MTQPSFLPHPTGQAVRIMTVGHSTRSLADFIHLLQAHGVTRLVDVRTIPRSRRNPQFNSDSLPGDLKKAGIDYIHLPGLGGLRRPRADSPNTGWENESFRGYADYMQTPGFEAALQQLIQLAGEGQAAIMCAEALPWRCHRSLIGDALLVRGFQVEDIFSATQRRLHRLTPFARVEGLQLTYPPAGTKDERRA